MSSRKTAGHASVTPAYMDYPVLALNLKKSTIQIVQKISTQVSNRHTFEWADGNFNIDWKTVRQNWQRSFYCLTVNKAIQGSFHLRVYITFSRNCRTSFHCESFTATLIFLSLHSWPFFMCLHQATYHVTSQRYSWTQFTNLPVSSRVGQQSFLGLVNVCAHSWPTHATTSQFA